MVKNLFFIFLFIICFKEVSAQNIQLISPNKLDIWEGGKPQVIRWEIKFDSAQENFFNTNPFSRPDEVNIELSTDDGVTWIKKVNSGQVNIESRQYEWSVLNENVEKAKIKIYTKDGIYIEEISETFRITKENKVSIINPLLNERLKSGDFANVIWNNSTDVTHGMLMLKYTTQTLKGSKLHDSIITIDTIKKISKGINNLKWRVPQIQGSVFNTFQIGIATDYDTTYGNKFSIIKDKVVRNTDKEYLLNFGSTFKFEEKFGLTGVYSNLYVDFKNVFFNQSTSALAGITFYKALFINNSPTGPILRKENDVNSFSADVTIYCDAIWKSCWDADYLYWGVYFEKRRQDIKTKQREIDGFNDTDTIETAFSSTIDEHFIGASPLIFVFENKAVEIRAIPILAFDFIGGRANKTRFVFKFNFLERSTNVNIGGEIRDFVFNKDEINSNKEVLLYMAKEFSFKSLIELILGK